MLYILSRARPLYPIPPSSQAIALLTLKMSEDQKYSLYNTLPVAGSAAASGVAAALNGIGGGMGLGAAGGGGMPAIMHSSMGMGSPYGPAPMQPLPYMQLPPQMYAAPQMVYPGQLGEGLGGGGPFTSLAINLTEEQVCRGGGSGRGWRGCGCGSSVPASAVASSTACHALQSQWARLLEVVLAG